jgi:hypothetical protein
MVIVAAFLGGIHKGIQIGRQRQKDDDKAAAEQAELLARITANYSDLLVDGELLQRLQKMQELPEEAAE